MLYWGMNYFLPSRWGHRFPFSVQCSCTSRALGLLSLSIIATLVFQQQLCGISTYAEELLRRDQNRTLQRVFSQFYYSHEANKVVSWRDFHEDYVICSLVVNLTYYLTLKSGKCTTGNVYSMKSWTIK